MTFYKKGDLAISTNAIVVLIIAVIMLGLIIGFVTKGFGAVSNQFLGTVDKLPNPDQPSSSSPITTSDLTLVSQGGQFGTKISVFNAGNTDATSVKPEISCGDTETVIASSQVNSYTIPAKGYVTFTYLAVVKKDAPIGKQLCQVKADLGSSGSVSADLIIEVNK